MFHPDEYREDRDADRDAQAGRGIAPSPFGRLLETENTQADAEDDENSPIPSGDAIAKEIQRFLRQQDSS